MILTSIICMILNINAKQNDGEFLDYTKKYYVTNAVYPDKFISNNVSAVGKDKSIVSFKPTGKNNSVEILVDGKNLCVYDNTIKICHGLKAPGHFRVKKVNNTEKYKIKIDDKRNFYIGAGNCIKLENDILRKKPCNNSSSREFFIFDAIEESDENNNNASNDVETEAHRSENDIKEPANNSFIKSYKYSYKNNLSSNACKLNSNNYQLPCIPYNMYNYGSNMQNPTFPYKTINGYPVLNQMNIAKDPSCEKAMAAYNSEYS